MSKTLAFQKYSGNGNDFIILDNPKSEITYKFVKDICDRNFGVGADGVLILKPFPDHGGRMQIYNADGGEAEMCGNGLRCLVTYLDKKNAQKKDSYLIKTMNGSYEIIRRDHTFAIEMSEVRDENLYDLSMIHEFDRSYFVNTGVPHLVFLVKNAKTIDIRPVAQRYRFHKMFPNGTNVSFVELLPEKQSAYVRTYERGVEDETQSCGTGLTAVGLALKAWLGWEGTMTLKTLGGTQKVEMSDRVLYWGEVKFCFSGEYPL